MPNLNISVELLASTIKQLNKEELEQLTLLLGEQNINSIHKKDTFLNKNSYRDRQVLSG